MARPIINVLIDLPPTQSYRRATFDALADAAELVGADPIIEAIATDRIDAKFVADLGDAVVLGPGTPYANPGAAEEVIRSARTRGVPLVGT